MDEPKISVKLLDDITECPICTESYSDPRSLPCVHTFCLRCIDQWSKDKLSVHSANCPLCRREFTIPKEGIGELPRNIFIAKLLAIKHVPKTTPVEIKLCDPCRAGSTLHNKKENVAELFCIDCQESLCRLCSELHSKMKLTRAHRTIVFGEHFNTPVTQLPTLCDKHPTKELELYCTECHETLCIVCFVTQHNGHKSAEITKVANDFRHDIRSNVSDLQKTAIRTLSNILESVQEKRQTCAEYFDKLEMEICDRAEELKATIERHKKLLLTELNERRLERLKEIDNTINEVSQNKALLDSFVKYNEELLNNGSDSEIARESHNLTIQSTELKGLCRKDIEISLQGSILTFIPSAMLSGSDSNVIGSLKINELDGESKMMMTQVPHKPAQFDSESICSCSSIESKDSKPCPTLTFSAESSVSVMALCTLDDRLYMTRYHAIYVEVRDTSTFQRQKDITLCNASNRLFGIAACSTNNCLYISDNENDEVHKFDLSDFRSSTKWSVGSRPCGLSVNRSHNLLVTCREDKKIQEYSSDGSLIREIKDIHNLYQAVELSKRTIVMSQIDVAHRIAVKSVDGRFIKCYGNINSGSEPGKMEDPRGLTVDSKGFILVADMGNNRILAVNPELTEARPLPLSRDVELTRPRAHWFDESRGRLYVAENNNKKRLLVFDSVNVRSLFCR